MGYPWHQTINKVSP